MILPMRKVLKPVGLEILKDLGNILHGALRLSW
jgi:hypothetical protein